MMKREERVGTNGKAITILTSENDTDREELHRLASAGEIDVAASFGDQPEKRKRLARLHRLAERVRARRARQRRPR